MWPFHWTDKPFGHNEVSILRGCHSSGLRCLFRTLKYPVGYQMHASCHAMLNKLEEGINCTSYILITADC